MVYAVGIDTAQTEAQLGMVSGVLGDDARQVRDTDHAIERQHGRALLIEAGEPEEVRIAVVDGRRLEEFYIERAAAGQQVGNIYKGIVTRVDTALQAAFVNYGPSKHGFLHGGDVLEAYEGASSVESVFDPHRAEGRRSHRPIEQLLRGGQEIAVQVTRDAVDHKGATLTTYLSFPGRFLVLMPGSSRGGVSRRITEEEARKALRAALEALTPPEGIGFIVRTAGLGRDAETLRSDFEYVTGVWQDVLHKLRIAKSPALVYQEQDLVVRAVRDVFREGVTGIVVDTETAREKASAFLTRVGVAAGDIVQRYCGQLPLLTRYGLEDEVSRLEEPRVRLPSGGSLVIEQTEAMVAIDVNSGRARGAKDPEAMILRTNLEAAEEVARQLRLRDLGGEIVIDFIDMEDEAFRLQVEDRFRSAIQPDRARLRIGKVSDFGLLELTRQRMRQGIAAASGTCQSCGGTGRVPLPETVALRAIRRIQSEAASAQEGAGIRVSLHPDVAAYLRDRKVERMADLERQRKVRIEVHSVPACPIQEIRIEVVSG